MRLLLDTHIWLWSLLEPENLSRKVRRALTSNDSELWLSPISVWESLLLAEKGRIELRPDPKSWIEQALEKAPLKEAPLTHDVALGSTSINLPHKDPADHFLVATAVVFDLTLVTSDDRLLATKGLKLLANR